MAENAQDTGWPQTAGPSVYSPEPSLPAKPTNSYVESLKSSDPSAYQRIANLAKFTANENFGGDVQDYQAQIFTPLSSDVIKNNKTLDLSSGVPKGVKPITEEVTSGQMDNPTITTNLTGYSKDLGVVNGIPITAVYDADGKLTGYQGDSSMRSFLDGSHSVSGSWDASGKPTPQSYSSHSGGFLGDIMSDPLLGTLAAGAAATFGGPLGSAALSLAQGKDFGDVLSSVAKGYALGSIGSGVSSALTPELTDLVKSGDLTASQAANLAKTVGGVASNVVAGADPLQALVNGGISAGTSAITSQIPGFEDLSKSQQRVVNSAVVSTLKGGDPTPSLINEAINTGVNAVKDYSPAPSSELVDQTIPQAEPNPELGRGSDIAPEPTPTPQPEPTPAVTEPTQEPEAAPENNPAPSSELVDQLIPKTDQTPASDYQDEFYKSIGIDPMSLSDIPAMTTDPLVGMSTRGDYNEITGKFEYDPNGSMEAPLDETTGTNLSSMDGYSYDPNTATWTSPDGTTTDLSYLSNTQKPMDMHSLDYLNSSSKDTDLAALARSLLSSSSKAGAIGAGVLGAGVLASLFGSDNATNSSNEPVQNQNVSYNPRTGSVTNGVAYGLDQLGTQYATKAAQGGIMSLAHGGMTSLGGYAAGGNPRLLRGPGDGMSDNIPATIAGKQPARLADGEFVVPADVVSHLGNGSTEAGANVLYQMMERVRKARTGNPKQGRQINPQKFIPNKGK